MRLLRGLGVVWAGLWLAPAQSADLPSGLQIHGFASQAFILTSDNDFFGDSDDGGSFDFTELGLNASLRPLPRLQLSAQILSRRAGEGDDGNIGLDYGFADYSFISNPTNLFGLRAGRIKNPLGLYNDTRDVAFTRPSILLPQSIYFDRTREVALSADSVQLYGEHRMRTELVDFQFGVIRPRVSGQESELALLGRDRPGALDDKTSFIGRVIYERDSGRLRFALTAAELNIGYDPADGVADDLSAGSIRFQPWILSAQYNAERWSLTAEYALRRFNIKGLGGIPDQSFTGESYYLQGTYRFSPRWEALLRYDVLFTDRDDRDGEGFAGATGRPAHNRFAKDLTVGLGWNITPSFLLRAEYHNVDGTGWLPIRDNPDLAATEEHWDMFLLQGSYRF
ncbi:MAG: hypothetical protein ACREVE_11480 [Gammaproteobacteria bacterium]